jgi:TPR repeat protein
MTEFEKAIAKVDKRTRKLAKAQNNLGGMYRHGEGVKQDDAEAVSWVTKAAEQGSMMAKRTLENWR